MFDLHPCRRSARGRLLRCLCFLLLPLLGSTAVFGRAIHRGTSRLTLSSGVAQTTSLRCGTCHPLELSLWVGHPHSHSLIDPAKDPRLIEAIWDYEIPGWRRHVAGRFEQRDVALVLGVLQVQVFFRRDGDGRHRLLPAQWNLRNKRWEPLPEELQEVRKSFGAWEEQCAGCHTTGFSPSDYTFDEANVACGACHGEGSDHMESGGVKPVTNPESIAPERQSDMCGACHSRGRSKSTGHPFPVGFQPGSVLAEVFLPEEPVPGEQTEFFWPNGVERLHGMEYQGFIQSGHYRGGLSCNTCHHSHGADAEHMLRRETTDICRGCHGEALETEPVHTAHPKIKSKEMCVGCHMPLINPKADQPRAHTHTFQFLDPSRALKTRMPSSCNVECHGDRGLRWAIDVLDKWRRP